MYVDTSTSKGKYTRYLLRQSYREDGKVKHRTIANLSHCSKEEIEAIRLALKHKDNLVSLASTENISFSQGISIGTGWLAFDIARQIGIVDALGPSRRAEQVLWMVLTRIIDYRLGLPAIRMPRSPAVLPPLRINPFKESDLYEALEWASINQALIENRLFKISHAKKNQKLFLYNITDSYLKGKDTELAAFGFDPAGRKGRERIAAGVLCDEAGKPLSAGIFSGDIQDSDILVSIVGEMSERFGGGEVVFVGNRRMITTQQSNELVRRGSHYITSITKEQIKDLSDDGLVRLDMFGRGIKDVMDDRNKRYIFRQDSVQVREVWTKLENRRLLLEQEVIEKNGYLMEHPHARVEVALRKIIQSCKKNKLIGWITPIAENRLISLEIDREAMNYAVQLEGFAGLETDLNKKVLSKEKVQERFNDFGLISWSFITGNSTGLANRYVFEQTENRSPGYLLVVMLTYRIIKELSDRWKDIGVTVETGLKELGTFCSTEMVVDGRSRLNKIPKPRRSVQKLLDAARISLDDTALQITGAD